MACWNYAIAILVVVVGVESSCPNGWMTHDTMCYHFSHDTEDFTGAMAICKLLGGQLVVIENGTEGAYLSNQATLASTSYWIAMMDLPEEGTWKWVYSGALVSSTSYHHWDKGQPDNLHANQNCAYIHGTNGRWADGACHGAMHYICEQAAM